MPNKSKIKGDTEERDVVNLHIQEGFAAQRTLERGKRSDGSPAWDIDIEAHRLLIGECKLRANGFKKIYDYLGECDFLTLRADRKERLYVLPESVWLELLKR